MSAEALYETLGLEGDEGEGTWANDGTVFVPVVVPRAALACRRCGPQRVHLDERARRGWKSAPLGVTPVVITMDSPKVKCLECGAKTWRQPTFARRHLQRDNDRDRPGRELANRCHDR